MNRERFRWLHRYIGLVMAGFLIVVGCTGSLLAWYDDLDALMWPARRSVTAPSYPNTTPLDPFELRDRVMTTIPEVRDDYLQLDTPPHQPVYFRLRTGTEHADRATEAYVDPYTGRELGRRAWSDISQGSKNVMPFIYRVHYSLFLDTVGTYALGIVALLWTLDCFVGAYLTLPRGRPFLHKWRPAWGIKRTRLHYDTHRAGGLWPWAMLFVFAWSGVAFNLKEVYSPVTRLVLDYRDHDADIPERESPPTTAPISFRDAYARARTLAEQESRRVGGSYLGQNYLAYDAERGAFVLGFTSSRDIDERGGGSQVWIDGSTGQLLKTVFPSGQHAGNTVTNWLTSLHTARVFGLPMRLLVTGVGLIVATLSITGFVIWWRKRRIQMQRLNPLVSQSAAPPGTP